MERSVLDQTLKRIQHMEQCFDTLLTAARSDPQAIYHSPTLRALLSELLRYYEGGQWLRDYEMDEQGGLPADLKRGVLSQDAIFDLLSTLDSFAYNTKPENDHNAKEQCT